MNRNPAVVLILVVIAAGLFAGWTASRRAAYFDPALYTNVYPCSLAESETPGPLDKEAESWFAGPLRAVNEPSLYRQRPRDGATTVRFAFLPAFVDPVIVRIDDLYGEHPRLTATRFVGQVMVSEGENRVVRDLSAPEVEPIKTLLASSGVLDLPPDSCLSGVDGYVFLIESSGPGGYRFINRWATSDGPVYDLANLMYGLTGWPNTFQGPDRNPEALERANPR